MEHGQGFPVALAVAPSSLNRLNCCVPERSCQGNTKVDFGLSPAGASRASALARESSGGAMRDHLPAMGTPAASQRRAAIWKCPRWFTGFARGQDDVGKGPRRLGSELDAQGGLGHAQQRMQQGRGVGAEIEHQIRPHALHPAGTDP